MITIRRASDRGHGQHGWLDTYHTFSFSDYYDPEQMGFRALRVINEDRVAPAMGFGTHGHQDMEILSYVLEGALAHKDSLGNRSVLRPGEVQCMTAGSGIRHSEFNPSESEAAHFYQIWLLPERKGLTPSYAQKAFPTEQRQGKLQLIVSPSGRDGSLTIHQDAEVFLGAYEKGEHASHPLDTGRHMWIQVIRGSIELNGLTLETSDGAAISDETSLTTLALEKCEIMMFNMP